MQVKRTAGFRSGTSKYIVAMVTAGVDRHDRSAVAEAHVKVGDRYPGHRTVLVFPLVLGAVVSTLSVADRLALEGNGVSGIWWGGGFEA